MLYYLIYTSKSTAQFNDKQLLDILEESRSWNQSHGLTGMLLYINGGKFHQQDGRFMQVLEGTEAEVKYIFEKIRKDPRHYNITLLSESVIKKRNFETWSMGFERMDYEAYEHSPGSFKLDQNFFSKLPIKNFNIPVMYLKSFYNMA